MSNTISSPKQFRSDVFIFSDAVKSRVVFSMTHVGRLEACGLFPRRVRLGVHCFAWSLLEVVGWMQSKVDARSFRSMPPLVVGLDDRFIGKKELRSLVALSGEYVRQLEIAGKFPKRVPIGPRRVAWLESEVREWMSARRDERQGSRSYDLPRL